MDEVAILHAGSSVELHHLKLYYQLIYKFHFKRNKQAKLRRLTWEINYNNGS